MQHPRTRPPGFTLVEMSIVIAVIGLLIGGIFGGIAAFRNSQMQSIISDYTKYAAAANQFTAQYGGPPGDIIDATNYWGKDTTNCNWYTDAAGSPGTCNGDGDGKIGGAPVNGMRESVDAWVHLQDAKLISGNYSLTIPVTLGTSAPRGRIIGTGWTFFNTTAVVGGTDYYNQDINNYLSFGSIATSSSTALTMTMGPAITATEAWKIDSKIDDGNPATGRVLSLKASVTAPTPLCATTAVDATAAYNVTSNLKNCSLMMSITMK